MALSPNDIMPTPAEAAICSKMEARIDWQMVRYYNDSLSYLFPFKEFFATLDPDLNLEKIKGRIVYMYAMAGWGRVCWVNTSSNSEGEYDTLRIKEFD